MARPTSISVLSSVIQANQTPNASAARASSPAGSASSAIAAKTAVAATAQRGARVSTKRRASHGPTIASSIVHTTGLDVRAASNATGEIASSRLIISAGSRLI